MIRLVLLTMIIPLLSCCSNTESKEQKLSAQTTADITRAHWEKAKKPFAITFKDNPEYSRLSEIEVKVDLQDATDEERHALQGVTFKSNNEIYTSSARAALTTDTTATIYACFPYRKELKDRDVIELAAPFGENLFATEVARTFGTSTNVNMKMQSSMAMLRIICESNNVKDMLDELKLAGDEIYISGEYQPFKGTWINKYIGSCLKATDANCLLNNGRKHDIYMIPTNK